MKKFNALRKELEVNHNKSLSRMIDIEKVMEAGDDAQNLINEAIEAINADIKATYEVTRPYSELLVDLDVSKKRAIKTKFYAIDKKNFEMKEKLEGMQTK